MADSRHSDRREDRESRRRIVAVKRIADLLYTKSSPHYVVGNLTNKKNITIYYYLFSYRLSVTFNFNELE